jgi:hypothetical protein
MRWLRRSHESCVILCPVAPDITITLGLKPEVQSQLATQAQAHGLAVEAYAQELPARAIGSEAEFWTISVSVCQVQKKPAATS